MNGWISAISSNPFCAPATAGSKATATGTFNSKDAGNRTATAVYALVDGTGGGLAANYSLANSTANAAITPKACLAPRNAK